MFGRGPLLWVPIETRVAIVVSYMGGTGAQANSRVLHPFSQRMPLMLSQRYEPQTLTLKVQELHEPKARAP